MTTAIAQPTTAAEYVDRRRITEHDADYQRLHVATVARLSESLRRFVRDLRRAASHPDQEAHVLSAFISRHTMLLARAYAAGHREGQRDYWQAVSLRRPPFTEPDERVQRQRLGFYAPSVAKMAHEALLALHASQAASTTLSDAHRDIYTLAGSPDPLAAWLTSTAARVELQAELTWAGMQDGYVAGGGDDVATPYQELWWNLGPVKTEHCADCPAYAAGSPYDPPWAGAGSNQLLASPGDGHTECGAACKCDLSYEPARDTSNSDQTWDLLKDFFGRHPDDFSLPHWLSTEELDALLATKLAPAQRDLNDGQQQALDLFRATWSSWELARKPGQPSLPHFFGDESVSAGGGSRLRTVDDVRTVEDVQTIGDVGDGVSDVDALEATLTAWDQLSQLQQDLLVQAFEAMLAWQEASGVGNVETTPPSDVGTGGNA